MILVSGRVIPNWILQRAFIMFNSDTDMADLIEDIEDIMQDELNVTDHSKLSTEDTLEILKKFNELWPDYELMLDEFFEKHNLGHDEYEYGDDDNDDDDNDNDNEPSTHEDLAKIGVK